MKYNEESTPLLGNSRRSSTVSLPIVGEGQTSTPLSDQEPSFCSTHTEKTTTYQFLKTMLPFMFLQASVGLCASLQATFYPIEAELKGATAAQFGAVFGIIHLSLFIFGKIAMLTRTFL